MDFDFLVHLECFSFPPVEDAALSKILLRIGEV
jgi:hypothetical protein